ncbi:MAG: AI-2E family transporter [Vulcanimicrobiota bacterium]
MNAILPKHVLGPGHVVLVLLSLVLLEWGRTLLLPLGMALVLLLTFLPVRNLWKEKIGLPGSGIVAFLACLAVLAGFCGLLWFIYHYHQAELAQLPRDLSSSLKSTGTSVKEVTDRLLSQATALEAILPALAFFFFGLVEYDLLRKRLLAALPSRQGEALLERVEHTSSLVGIYWLARTAAGLVTGLAVGLGCWLLDIPLAFLWASLNFLFNYIPTVGSLLASFLPAAYMLVQEGPEQAALTLLVVGGSQIVLGTFIDPLIQDRFLKLSAFTIFLAVFAFGWIWGPWGALIGVPITFIFGLLAREFPRLEALGLVLVGENHDAGTRTD